MKSRLSVAGGRGAGATALAICALAASVAVAKAGSGTPPATWSFASNTSIHPVRVRTLRNRGTTAPGYILVAPIGNVGVKHSAFYGQPGPLILDGHGEPVWQGSVPPGDVAMTFEAQRYQGKPVLTWWQGQLNMNGNGDGVGMVVDHRYETVAVVHAERGWYFDPHEFEITGKGTVLFIEDRPVRRDLSAFGGSRKGRVLDDVVVEEDIRTHRVVHRWDALRHVALNESYRRPPHGTAWDVFHMNSVAVGPNGDLLVSLRNNSALYSVDRRNGRIHWRLGGKHSSFALTSGARFARQHDARFVKAHEITVFDNEGPPGIHPQSRALTIHIDPRHHTARLLHSFTHRRPALLSGSQGSAQLLGNGHVFVGWGQMPYASEYSRSGSLLLDLQFPGQDESYRAFRSVWSGQPSWPPSVAVHPAGAVDVAYASWNGATQVARWEILAGSSPQALVPVANAPRSGFETAISVPSGAQYFAARALDAKGNTLGTSTVVKAG